MKNETKRITSYLFVHLRYERNWWCLATEVYSVGGNKADILAIHKDSLYEFEIKISHSDINNERNKIKHKAHKPYSHYYSIVIPHKKSLYKYVLKIVKKLNSKYGIITVKKSGIVIIKRKARRLHSTIYKNIDQIRKNIFQRATSEIAQRRRSELSKRSA